MGTPAERSAELTRNGRAGARRVAKEAEPAAASGLAVLAVAVHDCRRCPLWERATHAVFGEGPVAAHIMLVGEQPGDIEDQKGRPFVGPAGRILDDALAAAGVDRRAVYVTNVVKHFKWQLTRGAEGPPRGKRRLHSKPNGGEVRACLPWLEAEIGAIRPAVIVCLGSTAARALLGPAVRVTVQRGLWIPSPHAPHVMVTAHPSSILRQPTKEARAEALAGLVTDLKRIGERPSPVNHPSSMK